MNASARSGSAAGRAAARAALALALALVCAAAARAVEPVRLLVEGTAPISQENESSLRARALENALRQAVYEAALGYVARDRLQGREAELRSVLSPRSAALVLTYALEGAPQRRPNPDSPGQELFAIRAAVTVDGEGLRQLLADRGWISDRPARPSLVLRVIGAEGPPAAPLLDLQRFLEQRLRDQGYPMVDAGLSSTNAGGAEGAAQLGRRLGADLAVDFTVRRQALEPRTTASVPGALAEVNLRAVRVSDASELALSRYEAPGYNANPDLAFATALEALQDQLVQSLLFQLDRNLAALGSGASSLRVRLAGVTTLLQVEGVQRALVEQLGARSASVALLEPGSVELVVEGSLSAGALQERLAGLVFDGFSLEVSQVEASSVSLRVRPATEPAGAPAAPRPGGLRGSASQIDTRAGNG